MLRLVQCMEWEFEYLAQRESGSLMSDLAGLWAMLEEVLGTLKAEGVKRESGVTLCCLLW